MAACSRTERTSSAEGDSTPLHLVVCGLEEVLTEHRPQGKGKSLHLQPLPYQATMWRVSKAGTACGSCQDGVCMASLGLLLDAACWGSGTVPGFPGKKADGCDAGNRVQNPMAATAVVNTKVLYEVEIWKHLLGEF